MSLKILGPRQYFWQWDTGQKLVVDNNDCGEVHFCNGTGDCALVVEIQTAEDGARTVDVPDILLQIAMPIRAYLFQRNDNGSKTKTKHSFQVLPRAKHPDYVYTEVEILNYETLEKKIRKLEEDGVSDEQIATAVEKYLEENPFDPGVQFETDDTLILKDGILSVHTTNDMEQDNTLPITSAGVFATVGNIEVLLKTI